MARETTTNACIGSRSVIDLVTSLWRLQVLVAAGQLRDDWIEEDWNKAYSYGLRLRMVGTFLYGSRGKRLHDK